MAMKISITRPQMSAGLSAPMTVETSTLPTDAARALEDLAQAARREGSTRSPRPDLAVEVRLEEAGMTTVIEQPEGGLGEAVAALVDGVSRLRAP